MSGGTFFCLLVQTPAPRALSGPHGRVPGATLALWTLRRSQFLFFEHFNVSEIALWPVLFLCLLAPTPAPISAPTPAALASDGAPARAAAVLFPIVLFII